MSEHETGRERPADIGRAERMGILARASRAELEQALAGLPAARQVEPLRGPETGMVMLRGRIGGGGNRFNLGEATVSRASIRLGSGAVGHGQRLGTDQEAARLSAIADALAGQPDTAAAIDALLAAVTARLAGEAARLDAETQATRVDFFTMVRGEDQ